MRRQRVKFRTVQFNALHGLLLEFGETVRKGPTSLYKAMPEVLERLKEILPTFLIYQVEDQHRRLSDLDMQIDGVEKQLTALAKHNEACQRIMDIPGVGPLVSTAAVAIIGDAGSCRSGRESSRPTSVWRQSKQAQVARYDFWLLVSAVRPT